MVPSEISEDASDSDSESESEQENISECFLDLAEVEPKSMQIAARNKKKEAITKIKLKRQVKCLRKNIELKDDGIENFLRIVADKLMHYAGKESLADVVKEANRSFRPVDD